MVLFSWVDWYLIAAILLVASWDWWTTRAFVRLQGKESESNPFLREVVKDDQVPVSALFIRLLVIGIIALALPFKPAVWGLIIITLQMVVLNLSSIVQFKVHQHFGIVKIPDARDRLVLALGNVRANFVRAVVALLVGGFIFGWYQETLVLWIALWEFLLMLIQLINVVSRLKELDKL